MTAPVELNAITLRVTDMAASITFYDALGLDLIVEYGGPDSPFTTLRFADNFINLTAAEGPPETGWGRVIFHVTDPDGVCEAIHSAGYEPSTEPADAPWGERYFHVSDPDGHELSFARRL